MSDPRLTKSPANPNIHKVFPVMIGDTEITEELMMFRKDVSVAVSDRCDSASVSKTSKKKT